MILQILVFVGMFLLASVALFAGQWRRAFGEIPLPARYMCGVFGLGVLIWLGFASLAPVNEREFEDHASYEILVPESTKSMDGRLPDIDDPRQITYTFIVTPLHADHRITYVIQRNLMLSEIQSKLGSFVWENTGIHFSLGKTGIKVGLHYENDRGYRNYVRETLISHDHQSSALGESKVSYRLEDDQPLVNHAVLDVKTTDDHRAPWRLCENVGMFSRVHIFEHCAPVSAKLRRLSAGELLTEAGDQLPIEDPVSQRLADYQHTWRLPRGQAFAQDSSGILFYILLASACLAQLFTRYRTAAFTVFVAMCLGYTAWLDKIQVNRALDTFLDPASSVSDQSLAARTAASTFFWRESAAAGLAKWNPDGPGDETLATHVAKLRNALR